MKLKTTKKEIFKDMAREYTNDFLTVAKFAEYHGITEAIARQIIAYGGKLIIEDSKQKGPKDMTIAELRAILDDKKESRHNKIVADLELKNRGVLGD